MLVRAEQLHLLATRLERLALSAHARFSIRAIVAEPLRAIAHLQHLHELSGSVRSRNPGAAPRFMQTLFGGPIPPGPAPGWWQSGRVAIGKFGPCMPIGVIDPLAMLELSISVAVAANGDAGVHEHALDRLADLWDRAGRVDDLAHRALHGDADVPAVARVPVMLRLTWMSSEPSARSE